MATSKEYLDFVLEQLSDEKIIIRAADFICRLKLF